MKTIILSAFSCSPNSVSEGKAGWETLSTIIGHYEVHVFVDVRSEPYFDDALIEDLRKKRVFFYFIRAHGALHYLGEKFPSFRNVYYLSWQKKIAGEIRRRLPRLEVDLIHHITWARFSVPTSLGTLGPPVLFGPVGGAEQIPMSHWGDLSIKDRGRALTKAILLRWVAVSPRLKSSHRRLSLILAATPATRKALKKIAPEVPSLLESTLTSDEVGRDHWQSQGRRIMTSGRFIGWKGFHLVIKAFVDASDHWNELLIVGDGPNRKRLEKLATELSRPGKKIVFSGLVPLEKVKLFLRESTIYCFGSYHDSGAYSVLEALSFGLPVVCLDAGGPAVTVTEDSGIKVPVGSPSKTVSAMVSGLNRLAEDQDLRERLSVGGVERARMMLPSEVDKGRLALYRKLIDGDYASS